VKIAGLLRVIGTCTLMTVAAVVVNVAVPAVPTQAGGSDNAVQQWFQTTPSYSLELDIVSAMQMLTPAQAQTATSGMVMVAMPTMTMGSGSASMPMQMTMATSDEGQPVDHHLGVHIHDASTGALISNIMPTIMILNESTGQSETLNDVMPMYDMSAGQTDLHFGNNVYMPDGRYTVTVGVGQETAVFAHIAVYDAAGLSSN
jgi:hypothetical protein